MYVHFFNKPRPNVHFFDLFGQRKDLCSVLRYLQAKYFKDVTDKR